MAKEDKEEYQGANQSSGLVGEEAFFDLAGAFFFAAGAVAPACAPAAAVDFCFLGFEPSGESGLAASCGVLLPPTDDRFRAFAAPIAGEGASVGVGAGLSKPPPGFPPAATAPMYPPKAGLMAACWACTGKPYPPPPGVATPIGVPGVLGVIWA